MSISSLASTSAISSGVISYYNTATYSLLVHTATASPNGASLSTSPLNTTNSDIILFSVQIGNNVPYTVLDSFSNSWTQAFNSGSLLNTYYSINPIIGATHTFSVISTSASCIPSICVATFNYSNNLGLKPIIDQSTSFVGPSTPTIPANAQTSNLNPSFANSLVISSFGGLFLASDGIVPVGFTISDQILNSTENTRCAIAYSIQTAAQSVSPSWTYSWSGSSFCHASNAVLIFRGGY